MRADTQELMTTITGEDTLNTIIERYPNTMLVLQRFGLDTCCGGALPLRIAAQHHDLNLETLLSALHTAVEMELR